MEEEAPNYLEKILKIKSMKIFLKDLDKLWIDECLKFTKCTFRNNCFFVGCTQNSDRLNYLANKLNNNKNSFETEKNVELNFSENLKFLTQIDYQFLNTH